ncbi:deoxyribodipyrimidine photolyase-related protein [Herbaspirillum sp. Sphag1AN]|uniref:cryptochrome/photolyase family protein n=1 Tax=unclassified Herbaspirillum TaxID=2624150 RepID=UPI00160A3F61|nr:deoxyribodipyrimidine photolyase-related protein [Herbaspirillum sp. Sphag1AN]MBB3244068.1 deoxyribodipyrimidine photolyase-related protein [Herbaspirillum sp. Sphag64]
MSHAPANTIRLILGDQLNVQHPWFLDVDDDVVYLLMEIRQETDYVLHHAQKVIAIFAAMRDMARQLSEAGHRVHYLRISDPHNQLALEANLTAVLTHYQARHWQYQAPDEWRLDEQLYQMQRPIAAATGASGMMVDSAHFYTQRDEAASIFAQRKSWLMEHFYRQMRVKYLVLMDSDGKPAGGQWNYDQDNRKAWNGKPGEPLDLRPQHDHSALWQEIVDAGVKTFGQPQESRLRWPLNRTEALEQLENFITYALPHFGDFQDAMSTQAPRLFHSLLSFALNTKMLSPQEVVQRVEQAWRHGNVPLAAAEGYIRQILGWREYVRGVYWHRMPDYVTQNHFAHDAPLPEWFWTGRTKMRCMANAIGDSLTHAHAHHIQRLMVIGNFALLAGLDPQALHHWYLGVYIDAFEWVELPNTLGMSQFADGGMLATKPYVSGAAYINRMSDYCKGCHYDKAQRIGERACPYNALYWDFFARNEATLAKNPRIGMAYVTLRKMSEEERAAIGQQAATWRAGLDRL